MLILVSGATRTVPKFACCGRLIVPRAGNAPKALQCQPGRWAMDNGAFAGFDATRFVAMLDRYRRERGCLFVVTPDVVGDAAATLKLWPFWSQAIRGYGFPVAFVAQDGLTPQQTPWAELDALFIGGTTAFKLSREARMLAGYAKARGKWLHMGRVNSRRRVKYALQLGCDSIDGTGWCRWADIRLALGTRWLREFAQQPELRL